MPTFPAGMEGDVEQPMRATDGVDELAGVDGDGDAAVQKPRGRPDPGVPTLEEILRHNLTHLPYRKWCRICVMARRRNDGHYRLPPFSRAKPLLVADYCFVRNSLDDDVLVLMVCRLYPSMAICAIPCDMKGVDRYSTHMLASFLRGSGVPRMVYLCDQEKSIHACIVAAAHIMKIDAHWEGAVPENSAVGQSASNGRAEQAVQAVEDHMRTLKCALEERIAARIPSTHPASLWIAADCCVLKQLHSGHRWRFAL